MTLAILPRPVARRKWPTYPAYRDSQIDWLGDVPTHWEVKRLRFMLAVRPTATEIKNLDPSVPVSFLPMESIGDNGTFDQESSKPLKDIGSGYTYFRERDVTVAKITPCFENGKGALMVGLINGIGFGTTELHVLRPGISLDSKFLYYFTMSYPFRTIGASYMYGAGGQKRVPEEYIRELRCAFPPLCEQRAIAAFLDRETAKIDALVAKKERLIALLAEKRTALISQAVTQGLDPAVPRQDSGVAWLGLIPAHWAVKRLKHVVTHIGSGKTPKGGAEIYSPEGVLFLRSQNIHFDGLRLDDVVYISEDIDTEMESTRVQCGDVLLNITGASLGRCSSVPDNFPPANVNQHVCIVRPIHTTADSEFLHGVISSNVVQAQIFAGEKGTSREGLTFPQIASFVLAIPDLAEQQAIVCYIKLKTSTLNSIIGRTRQQIGKLQEYRTALIAAAVTGQIDVREETRPPDGV